MRRLCVEPVFYSKEFGLATTDLELGFSGFAIAFVQPLSPLCLLRTTFNCWMSHASTNAVLHVDSAPRMQALQSSMSLFDRSSHYQRREKNATNSNIIALRTGHVSFPASPYSDRV